MYVSPVGTVTGLFEFIYLKYTSRYFAAYQDSDQSEICMVLFIKAALWPS